MIHYRESVSNALSHIYPDPYAKLVFDPTGYGRSNLAFLNVMDSPVDERNNKTAKPSTNISYTSGLFRRCYLGFGSKLRVERDKLSQSRHKGESHDVTFRSAGNCQILNLKVT